MSIERQRNAYIPTCDTCGDMLPAEFDFYDAVDAKKAAGWKAVNDCGEWFDYCPTCYEKVWLKISGAASDFAGFKNTEVANE